MRYDLVDGKVQTRSLEYHIADHCNLRCEHCCSYSPLLKKWFADPAEVERDLRAAARVVAPEFLKLVGGEPLLHPALEDLLLLARSLHVGRRIQLTTNGFLVDRLTPRAWECLDVLTVSLYPEPALPKEKIRFIAREARQRKIEVSWKVQDRFTCLDRSQVATPQEAATTFRDCWIRHRCHSVKGGRFFCCTRPQYAQKFTAGQEGFAIDGVALHEKDPEVLAMEIKSYLERDKPLQTCFLCNGGQAPLMTHRQLSPFAVRERREQIVTLAQGVAAGR